LLIALAFIASGGHAQSDTIDDRFEHVVKPFLGAYCSSCHNSQQAEAKLDLTVYRTPQDVVQSFAVWELVASRVHAHEMPPADATNQPPPERRKEFEVWYDAWRKREAASQDGDPGVVLTRRLSNAEYNYCVRDLTGVDLQPTRVFPVDPANEAGFDNSGESLTMSPELLNKYLAAARGVSEHLVLHPNGFSFAPHPIIADTDRDKYCVKRIVQFYQSQPTDLTEYFFAAWQCRTRASTQSSQVALVAIAKERKLSEKYLKQVWSILTDRIEETGPTRELQTMWNALPSRSDNVAEAKAGCNTMREFVLRIRRKLEPILDNLEVKGIHKGSQPFVLWKNNQYASYRRYYDNKALLTAASSEPCLQQPQTPEAMKSFEVGLARFCSVFPDAFYVSERGRDYEGKPREKQEKGRLLSAGFHSMMGYYRDDAPLCDLILSETQRSELDALWQELDFVTRAPMRQYSGFVWFERTDSAYMRDVEFDFARAEDKSVTDAAMIHRLADAYIAKAKSRTQDPIPLGALKDYFDGINRQIRWVEKARREAEPKHLTALLEFAEKAWRRPLETSEREQLLSFYRSLRELESLEHEEAIQDAVVAILMSPYFSYRMDHAVPGAARRPLQDFEIASRLSFFLWSSLPDAELRELAQKQQLRNEDVLRSQMKRMLADPKARSLAVEFAGNWLDYRRFDEHNSVDRNKFPQFTDALRNAMFEEPIRFFQHLVQNNSSVLDLIHGKYTFVNATLASHYKIPDRLVPRSSIEDWVRIDDATAFGRGGLLPMSVFLTKNAPGLRTSPVKRGYWVVKRLLGETIPAPPPNVPELPAAESQLGERSLREALAQHRQHVACSGCHNRIDSIGLVFENYGPIGERRVRDLGGRQVDCVAEFPDGSQGEGVEGLKAYIRSNREIDFVDNLCRKLLSYALGRTLLLSDDPLIERMRIALSEDDYRFQTLIGVIITSPQFLEKRGDSHPPARPSPKP
jgi:hypothetical protein